MSLFSKPYPKNNKQEVIALINELIEIGKRDDFLSERAGHPFNAQCRHIRAREIGTRLDEIGGFDLMEYAAHRIRKKLGIEMFSHLEFAWAEIGRWMP